MSYLSGLLCTAVLFQCVLSQESLHLLLILPFNCSTAPGRIGSWGRGSQLQTAVESMVDTINQDSNILHNYTLEISVVNTVTCYPTRNSGATHVLPSLVNSTDKQGLIAAIDVFYPDTAKLLTKLTQHRKHDKLKLPLFIGSLYLPPGTEFSANQFGMLDLALSMAKAVVSFLEHQHWTRIAVITDLENTYYLQVAETFVKQLKGRDGISVSFYLQAQDFITLKGFDANVVLVSAGLEVSRQVIAKAKENNWSWPTHAWMFHTHSPEDLSSNTSINGMFFFQNSLMDKNRLRNCIGISCHKTNNAYVHFLYKTILLSALVINLTLFDEGMNYGMALHRINSLGLLEGLAFNESTHTLFSSTVHISQATSGRLASVGYYHFEEGHLDITNEGIRENEIPPSIVFRSRQVFILVVTYAEIVFCFLLVTVDFILYVHYRKQPEVKATSFSVSMALFLACYVLVIYLIILAASTGKTRLDNAICLARSWINLLSLPGTLIVATVLVKMLRVYAIFRPDNFKKIGKRFSDTALFLYIALLHIPCVTIAALWNILDPYTKMETRIQKTNFVFIKEECYSENLSLWPSLLVSYNCLLTGLLAIVAIKTRKVRKTHFKDTKKVNIFVFLYQFMVGTLLSLWITARNLHNFTYSDVALRVSHTCMVVLVQVTLFVPKLYPPLLRDWQHSRWRRRELGHHC